MENPCHLYNQKLNLPGRNKHLGAHVNCSGETSGRLTLSWMQPFSPLSPPWLRDAHLGSPELMTSRPEGLEQSAGWCQVQAHSMAAEPSLG